MDPIDIFNAFTLGKFEINPEKKSMAFGIGLFFYILIGVAIGGIMAVRILG
jgi:hypothetical protein